MISTAREVTNQPQLINSVTNHFIKQKYPQKHHHYNFRDFFSFQRETGTIIDWNESRNILVSESFIVGLISGIEEEIGEASSVVMYNIGEEWEKKMPILFKIGFAKNMVTKISLNLI